MSADDTQPTSPSLRVVEAVAAARDVETIELEPLSNRLDLESIDTLLANSTDDVRVECILDELRVEVEPDGSVHVSPVPPG